MASRSAYIHAGACNWGTFPAIKALIIQATLDELNREVDNRNDWVGCVKVAVEAFEKSGWETHKKSLAFYQIAQCSARFVVPRDKSLPWTWREAQSHAEYKAWESLEECRHQRIQNIEQSDADDFADLVTWAGIPQNLSVASPYDCSDHDWEDGSGNDSEDGLDDEKCVTDIRNVYLVSDYNEREEMLGKLRTFSPERRDGVASYVVSCKAFPFSQC